MNDPQPKAEAPAKPEPRIIVMRSVTRLERALLMVQYSAKYDVFGPFDISKLPIEEGAVIGVHYDGPSGTTSRSYRCFELVREVDGKEESSGFCYAVDWQALKLFAWKKLGITIIGRG